MPHSGTTLLSQMLNSHPRIASGVECGLLLARPGEFDKLAPYWDWFLDGNWSWGLTRADRQRLLTAQTHSEAYRVLNSVKGKSLDGVLFNFYQSADLIYDKTPEYVYHLPDIASKIDVPFIITVKWPADALESSRKRKESFFGFSRRYINAIRRINSSRALIVSYSDLSSDINRSMERVSSYLSLDGKITLEEYNRVFGRFIVSKNSFRSDRVFYVPAKRGLAARIIEWILRPELSQLKKRAAEPGANTIP